MFISSLKVGQVYLKDMTVHPQKCTISTQRFVQIKISFWEFDLCIFSMDSGCYAALNFGEEKRRLAAECMSCVIGG